MLCSPLWASFVSANTHWYGGSLTPSNALEMHYKQCSHSPWQDSSETSHSSTARAKPSRSASRLCDPVPPSLPHLTSPTASPATLFLLLYNQIHPNIIF